MAMKDFSKAHVDLNCSHTFERAGGLADRRSFCSFAAAVVEIQVTRSAGRGRSVAAVKAKIKNQSGKNQKSTKPPHQRS